jgi:3,4-dehydroadipyl-CoA semialdehyde dehydrogenase
MVEAGICRPARCRWCGSSAGLLDALQPMDVVSFTGSADTAARSAATRPWRSRSVRSNIEADSVNCALLLPGDGPGSEAFELLARKWCAR